MGQKRGRFGRKTGATVRRTIWRDRMLLQEVCVIQKKVEYNVEGACRRNTFCEKKKEILAEFESQFDDGGLEVGFMSSYDYSLFYSLNKCKRWELPNILKDNITFDPLHETNEFEVILVEYSMGSPITNLSECIGIHKSKGEVHHKQPRDKYAHPDDLINVEQNAKVSNANRNSGNRRKRRVKSEDIEPKTPIPCIKYEVTYARPREQYPYFTTRHCFGYIDGSSKGRLKKKKQRYNKLYRLEFEEDEDDYYSGYSDCDDGYTGDGEGMAYVYNPEFSIGPPPLLSLKDHLKFSDTPNRLQNENKSQKKKKRKKCTICSETKISGKDRKITIPSPDVPTSSISTSPAATRTVSLDSLPKISPTISVLITKSSNTPKCLESIFKSDYIEGASLPRRFLIDLTFHVCDNLNKQGMCQAAKHLGKTGRRIIVIFTKVQKDLSESIVNNASTEKNSQLLEEVDDFRVRTFGLQFVSKYKHELTNALRNSKTFSVTDVVSKIKTILDQLPAKYFYADLKTSKGALSHLAFKSLQRHLQQVYEVTTPHSLQMINTNEATKILSSQIAQQNSCGICFEDLLPSVGGCSGTALGSCQHWFCDYCWRHHIRTRIGRGDCSILCPEYRCNSKVDTPTLMSLTSNSQFENHINHKQNRIVDNDPSWHWCPGPGCRHIGKVRQCKDGHGFVPCDCGKAWCVECKEDVHWPASCQQAEDYTNIIRKRNDYNYISSVKVKRCPHCHRHFEKNGGCPNMECICGKIFCWVCLKPHYFSPECYNTTKSFETVEIYPVMIGVAKDELLIKAFEFKKLGSKSVFTKMKGGVTDLLIKTYVKTIRKTSYKNDQLSAKKRICSCGSTEEQRKIHKEAVAMAEEVAEFYTETYHFLEWTYVLVAYSVVSHSKIMERISHLLPKLLIVLQALDEIVSEKRTVCVNAKNTFRQLLTSGKRRRQILCNSASNVRIEEQEKLIMERN